MNQQCHLSNRKTAGSLSYYKCAVLSKSIICAPPTDETWVETREAMEEKGRKKKDKEMTIIISISSTCLEKSSRI